MKDIKAVLLNVKYSLYNTYTIYYALLIVWQKPTQHCKVIILQLKIKIKKPPQKKKKKHWSGLPLPNPDLPDPGREPVSLAYPALASRFFTTEPT